MALIRLELWGWGLLNAFGLLMGFTSLQLQRIHGDPPYNAVHWLVIGLVNIIPGVMLINRGSHFARLMDGETRYLLCCLAGANTIVIPFFAIARQIIWMWTGINPW